jgi:hypothetical protein
MTGMPRSRASEPEESRKVQKKLRVEKSNQSDMCNSANHNIVNEKDSLTCFPFEVAR